LRVHQLLALDLSDTRLAFSTLDADFRAPRSARTVDLAISAPVVSFSSELSEVLSYNTNRASPSPDLRHSICSLTTSIAGRGMPKIARLGARLPE